MEPAARGLPLPIGWLVAAVAMVVIGFSIVCGSALLDIRRGDEELSRQTSSNLASAIHADVVRNLELYDLSLRNVVDGLKLPEIAQFSKPVKHMILFDRAATAKHFGPIKYFDETGGLQLDASSLTPAPYNAAGEEYFAVHARDAQAGLFISKPQSSRSGEYVLFVSHRINHADGSFAGVAAGSIRLSYFHDLFRRVKMDDNDAMTLFLKDGTVVMRQPFDVSVIGRAVARIANFKEMTEKDTGSFDAVASIDGIERQYVWKTGTVPLIMVVGKSMDGVLARWRFEAFRIGSVMGGLALVAVAFTVMLMREMKRRARAEDKLAALASTDALTGLCNRRQFDKIILAEWSRAHRGKLPISLLMVDADHFKGFNDTFGHQAGDAVLAGIGACIAENVRRTADCGARYGGEEFAVLLPGISADDAYQIAESIRFGVAGLPSEYRAITVSIGVATLVPTDGIDHRDLIYAADVALYQAKSRGRNATVMTRLQHAQAA